MSFRIEKGLKLRRLQIKYQRISRKQKTKLLNELGGIYNLNRKYLIRLLNRKSNQSQKRKGPKPIYNTEAILPVLRIIWLATDQLCSKRLKVAMNLWLPFYEREYGVLDPITREQLMEISPATIDRLLKPVRVSCKKRRLGGTKPGTLLKTQIPIRTGSWNEDQPGFVEADTIAHCGNSLAGDFVWSITLTDICSCWTENRAVWNKGAAGVVKQVKSIERNLPFELLGFDCDNGSEFLNYHLIRYFSNDRHQLRIQFTRSRSYHKNDNAHVEQKNWTHVRQLFGYDRLNKFPIVGLMNKLYMNEWSDFQNHFCPSMKLVTKEKINSKYKKKYEKPKTPYERLLSHSKVSEKTKQQLQQKHEQLNPFELKRRIEKQLQNIFKYVKVSSKARKRI